MCIVSNYSINELLRLCWKKKLFLKTEIVCCVRLWISDFLIVGELHMPYFVHRSWRDHSDHVHRTRCVDERQLRSFVMSVSIRTASSIQWFHSTARPIYRWSMPWMQSMPRNREPMAEGRQPSIWTTTTMATKVSLSFYLYHGLNCIRSQCERKKEKKKTRVKPLKLRSY